jgi:hypothetical protein
MGEEVKEAVKMKIVSVLDLINARLLIRTLFIAASVITSSFILLITFGTEVSLTPQLLILACVLPIFLLMIGIPIYWYLGFKINMAFARLNILEQLRTLLKQLGIKL